MKKDTNSAALNRTIALAMEIRRRLLGFYDAGKRDLPWRRETDPYRVWVSEVMLQQTRVETVIPYYQEWMKRFPDLKSLAEAQEDAVLSAWQGLGYYSRARNLRRGAQVVRERHGGALPRSKAELQGIPGVGEYTAGAVASIAFGEPVPAVDGNVRRVLSRLLDLPNPGAAELQSLAGALVDRARPGDFNQALMEFGATLCTPRSPSCQLCPLSSFCLALERGTVLERPPVRSRGAVPTKKILTLVAVVLTDGQGPRFLIRKRPGEGLLAGMWEFPGVEWGPGKDTGKKVGMDPAEKPGVEALENLAGLMERHGLLPTGDPLLLPMVSHQFTHLMHRYHPVLQFVGGAAVSSEREEGAAVAWVTSKEMGSFPLPAAQSAMAKAAVRRVEKHLRRDGASVPSLPEDSPPG